MIIRHSCDNKNHCIILDNVTQFYILNFKDNYKYYSIKFEFIGGTTAIWEYGDDIQANKNRDIDFKNLKNTLV